MRQLFDRVDSVRQTGLCAPLLISASRLVSAADAIVQLNAVGVAGSVTVRGGQTAFGPGDPVPPPNVTQSALTRRNYRKEVPAVTGRKSLVPGLVRSGADRPPAA